MNHDEQLNQFMRDASVHTPAKQALKLLYEGRDPIDAMKDANAIARILRRRAIAILNDGEVHTAGSS